MNKILNTREQAILFITIVIIIFAVIFNILIAPILEKNNELNREIAVTRTRLIKYSRLLSQKETIEAKYNKLAIPGLNIEQSGTLVAALSEIQALANNAGIRLLDIRPQTQRSAAAKEIAIDVRAEGSMDSYMKFIYQIEHSLSSLAIKKIQIGAKPNTQSLEGNFTISQPQASE